MIHACWNNCILYWKEYEDLDRCPMCNVSRYKFNDDCEDEDDSANVKKKKKKSSDGVEEFEEKFFQCDKEEKNSCHGHVVPSSYLSIVAFVFEPYVDNQFWLTSDTFEHGRVIPKDSVEKVVNMKVLHIFKMNKFVFGVILIRVSIRSTKPRQGVQTEAIQHEYWSDSEMIKDRVGRSLR